MQNNINDLETIIETYRGITGVYMPEPNEKERARVEMMNAIQKYLNVTNEDVTVLNISFKPEGRTRQRRYSVTIERKSGKRKENEYATERI